MAVFGRSPILDRFIAVVDVKKLECCCVYKSEHNTNKKQKEPAWEGETRTGVGQGTAVAQTKMLLARGQRWPPLFHQTDMGAAIFPGHKARPTPGLFFPKEQVQI